MLNPDDIAARIRSGLPDTEWVEVRDLTGTGDHFEAKVVSPSFSKLPMIAQHQKVYAPLQDWLRTGELHALALKTYTPEQWKKLSTPPRNS